ncbi:MAG: porin family protein [Bacteroidaceae bacterium]|nr:porin family protein [Bacteroidaceae bacterium]
MKKIFAAAALMLLIAVPASAQFSYGLKAGLNVSKASLDWSTVSSDNQTGFFVGPMVEFTVPLVGVGVDASLLYNNKGMKLKDVTSGNSFSQTLQYIDIPINLKYTYGLGSIAGVFVTTGPQFSFNISSKKLKIADYTLKSSEFSWNVGLGAKLLGHLQVAYNYNIAIGKTSEFEYYDTAMNLVKGKLKNNTHQISLAYMF